MGFCAGPGEPEGGGVGMVKLVELVAVPDDVVTDIEPVVAVLGTTAIIVVSDTTLGDDAATPLNVTEVAPVKPVPVIVTTAVGGANCGVNEVIVGAAAKAGVKKPPSREEVRRIAKIIDLCILATISMF